MTILKSTARKLSNPAQYRAAVTALDVYDAHADKLNTLAERETHANIVFNHTLARSAERKAVKAAALYDKAHDEFCDALIGSVDLDALLGAAKTARSESKRLRSVEWTNLDNTLHILWVRASNRLNDR